ncbi:MAG: DEAD/DEAH box helicase [Candidatus Pacearchaeota archaeon]
MEKFTKLGLRKELAESLVRLGFTEPSEIQEKVIPAGLEGKDIIGGSATGSGKTLAFASVILERIKPYKHIQALVLTPTRELAEQVAGSIRQFDTTKQLNVLAVYGGARIEQQIRKLAHTDILVGTPGRILDHLSRRTLNLSDVKFLVLDEVDRLFDMGFSKDVEKIIAEVPKERQTLMFSATISQEMDYFGKKYTKNPVEVSLKSQVDPLKLKQVYYDVMQNKKFALLVTLLKHEDANLVMVFCNTRRNADFITQNLIHSGIDAKSIHGGIEQKKRIQVLEQFHKNKLGVLVCTDVAARGLDIKGVTHVYNYDVPGELNEYVHRIGRTARAGEEGIAITILSSRDYENFRNLMRGEDVNITSAKLPHIDYVSLKPESTRNGRFNRNYPRGGSSSSSRDGRSRDRDSSRGRNYGNRGRSSSSSREGSRFGNRDSSPRGRNYGRSRDGDSSRRGYGNRDSSSRRDSPRGRRPMRVPMIRRGPSRRR